MEGMIDVQGGEEMNKQRKVLFTITYNEMGIIVDTKAEELGSSAQPEPCEDAVSRHRLYSDLKELIVAWEKYPVMAEQIKGVETAIGYVKTIPSVTPKAEQPEIIRCRECEYHRKENSGVYYCSRKEYGYGWGLNDFCSDAKRREESGK